MNLSKLIKKDVKATFQYPDIDGFEITLKYVGKAELKRMHEACSTKTYDIRSRTHTEKFNPDKFRELIADELIIEWKGLTYGKLGKLIPLDMDVLKAENLKETDIVESTRENKLIVLDNSMEFDTWVGEMIKDAVNFKDEAKKAEFENLK